MVTSVTTVTTVTPVITVTNVTPVTILTTVAQVDMFNLPFNTLKVLFSQSSPADRRTDRQTDQLTTRILELLRAAKTKNVNFFKDYIAFYGG